MISKAEWDKSERKQLFEAVGGGRGIRGRGRPKILIALGELEGIRAAFRKGIQLPDALELLGVKSPVTFYRLLDRYGLREEWAENKRIVMSQAQHLVKSSAWDKNVEMMTALMDQGATLEEMGNRIGLSRERI